jgi:hypothetical protein
MNHAMVNDEIDGWVTCMTEGGARPGVGPSALRLLDICSSTTCHCQSPLSYYWQRIVEENIRRWLQMQFEEECALCARAQM